MSLSGLEVVHMSNQSITKRIETHKIEGISVEIFSPAKTAADCSKFRESASRALPLCRSLPHPNGNAPAHRGDHVVHLS